MYMVSSEHVDAHLRLEVRESQKLFFGARVSLQRENPQWAVLRDLEISRMPNGGREPWPSTGLPSSTRVLEFSAYSIIVPKSGFRLLEWKISTREWVPDLSRVPDHPVLEGGTERGVHE